MGAGARTARIVVDLGYGDTGKGAIVDGLVRRYGSTLVVRYNGGAQAGHRVVAPDGHAHVFAQFGSGTFVPGVRTLCSRSMVVHPLAMLEEEAHLAALGVTDAFARTAIEADARCITPFHQAANRLRELARGPGRHGSCGLGVGEAVTESLRWGDTLRARDLRNPAVLRRKLAETRDRMIATVPPEVRCGTGDATAREWRILTDPTVVDHCAVMFRAFAERARIVGAGEADAWIRAAVAPVFEGAQGVLLDERHGFHPYTTWSTTTSRNAFALLDAAGFDGPIETIGVVRAYATRHGPGPFVTEDAALTAQLPDAGNAFSAWQREFRIGWFDAVATRYALAVDGRVRTLAVTNLDRLRAVPAWRVCTAYRMGGERMGSLDVFDPPDRARQAERTRQLLAAAPEYGHASDARAFTARAEQFLRFLEGALEYHVRIASFGPTAADQRLGGAR